MRNSIADNGKRTSVNSAAGKGDGKIERRSPEEGYTT